MGLSGCGEREQLRRGFAKPPGAVALKFSHATAGLHIGGLVARSFSLALKVRHLSQYESAIAKPMPNGGRVIPC